MTAIPALLIPAFKIFAQADLILAVIMTPAPPIPAQPAAFTLLLTVMIWISAPLTVVTEGHAYTYLPFPCAMTAMPVRLTLAAVAPANTLPLIVMMATCVRMISVSAATVSTLPSTVTMLIPALLTSALAEFAHTSPSTAMMPTFARLMTVIHYPAAFIRL